MLTALRARESGVGPSPRSRGLRLALVVQLALGVGGAVRVSAQPAEGVRFAVGSAVVELGGQVRLRFEDDRAFDVRGYRPAIDDRFLLSRIMLDASVRVSPRHRVFLELRDARQTGSNLRDTDFPRNNPFSDTLDIRQFFYEGRPTGDAGIGVRLGRQQISYGDQRVFGPGQWGNTGRWAWDAALVNLKASRVDADLWIGRPVRNRPDRWPNASVPEPVVAAAYVRALKLPMRLDVFYVHKHQDSGLTSGESGPGNLGAHSLGFQAEGTQAWLDYALTGVIQRGDWGQDSIRAGGASGTLGVRMTAPWRPRIRAVVTWGSGDRDPHDGVHGTFDGVVGGADIAFYGYCNLFFWANLWDRELQVLLRPTNTLDVHIQGHAFSLASGRDAWYSTSLLAVRRDPSGASGVGLGSEIDVRAIYRVRPGIELMAGLSYFRPGSFIRQTGQARDAWWRMAQASWSW
jgi:hypothetical protein